MRAIRVVEWDYIFIDGGTREEVARHHFYSETKVRPHQRKTVVEYSSSSPTRVISVRALSQRESNRLRGRSRVVAGQYLVKIRLLIQLQNCYFAVAQAYTS